MSLDHFIRLADSIVEFEADLNDNQYPMTAQALEVHKYELRSTWAGIKAAYEKFLIESEKESANSDDPLDIESCKLKYKSTYTTYCKCLSKISEMSDSLRPKNISASLDNTEMPNPISFKDSSSPSSSNFQSLHLPPLEIETFSGDYASWPTFRDMFTAIIHNSRASNVEKLFFLTQKTKGEARDIVKMSPLTNQGFDLAWRDLCARYENRRVLVNGQLKILFNLQTITTESGKALKQLQRDINSCISILKLYKIDVATWDPIFVHICTSRLPETTLTLWEQNLKDKSDLPEWLELDNFLTNRHRTLESVKEICSLQRSRGHDARSKANPAGSSGKKVHSFQTHVSGPICQLCPNESHAIRKCSKFLKMDYNQRQNEIRKEGLCLNCFSKTHSVKNCPSKHSCYKCGKRHNTLLHKEPDKPAISISNHPKPSSAPNTNSFHPKIQSTGISNPGVVQSCFVANARGILLGTALVNIYHLGLTYQARALLDSGSEGSFISEKLFNILKLPSERVNAQISGLNNSISAKVQRKCSFVIGSRLNEALKLPVTGLVVPHFSTSLPSQSIPKSTFTSLPNIELADPNFYCSSGIDILLGGDMFPLIIRSGIQHNMCGSLIAQETVFGWTITGPVSGDSTQKSTIISHFCEISLNREIARFWEVEDLPGKNYRTPSDQACEDLYERTTRRNSDGRYIVSLPFKDQFSEKLGHSRTSALAQFFRNEARLNRTPTLKSEYDKVVHEYEELDHMVKVKPPDVAEATEVYYLPHHAVIKPDSLTTKVRVVFNASSPSSNGLSLNSLLHVGPVLQNDLTLLLIKWRFFRFVFNADIEKMYRQILVHPDHTRFQRIVFRSDPNDFIQDYELKTVTFGVNCAPYLAIRTLLQLADDVQNVFPIASKIIRHYMYIDDVLAGAHSKWEAQSAKN